jgi:O-antigen ligase
MRCLERMEDRFHFFLAAVFLVVAFAFGGGGTPAPMAELAVQLCAIFALIIWPFLPSSNEPQETDKVLWIAVALFVAIPLIQLVPLPATLWHSLSGREREIAALRLIGSENSWRPISMSPYRTIASTLSLVPPVAMIFLVSKMPLEDRTSLLAVAGAMGCAAALLGLLQVVGGTDNWLRFYATGQAGFASGFQANRNGNGDILLICMLAICGYVATNQEIVRSTIGKAVAGGVLLYVALSVVMTGSRTATLLIFIVILFALLLFRVRVSGKRATLIAGLCILCAGVGTVALATSNRAVERTLSRFDLASGRSDIWKDAEFARRTYWPIGSGVGTFIPAFEAAERLEAVDDSTPNRAHNDYLEFAIEAGFPGLAIVAVLIALLVGRTMIQLSATGSQRKAHTLFSMGALTVLGLHSIVDYPMRSMSLAVLAGLAIGLTSNGEMRARKALGRTNTDRKAMATR